jgi:hypothetical protein
VKALLRINEAEEASVGRRARSKSPKVVLGVILTAGAFFANQVPKEAFQYLGLKEYYAPYRATAFIVFAFVLCYTALVWFYFDWLMGRSSPRRVACDLALVQLVLVHLDATLESRMVDEPP